MKIQSFKYGDFINDVYKLLERYSSNGLTLEVGEKKDIQKRFVSCANRAMRKLCSEFGVYRRKINFAFESPQILYDYGCFELSGEEMFSKNISGTSLAYRLVAGGNGELAFIDCKDTESVSVRNGMGEISEYKGIITPNGDNSHFLLAGTPDIKVYSFEIYCNSLSGEEELSLLCGRDICTLKLPEDFLRLCAVYDKNGKKADDAFFDISSDGVYVSIPADMAGVYTLEYIAAHEPFAESYSDSNVVKLPPVLYDALCYMCSAELCPSYDGEMYSKLTYKYREILENCYKRERKLQNGRNSFYGVVSDRFRGRHGKAGV